MHSFLNSDRISKFSLPLSEQAYVELQLLHSICDIGTLGTQEVGCQTEIGRTGALDDAVVVVFRVRHPNWSLEVS